MARVRLALFAPYLPAPAHSGGRIRIDHFARALRAFADVHLFASADACDVELHGGAAELEEYCSLTIASPGLGFLPAVNRPSRVRRASPRRLCAAFRDAHAQKPFDVAVVEHAHAAAIAVGCGLPWVLDEHNVESEYLRSRFRADGASASPWKKLEVRALERWETKIWRSAHAVSCVSHQDGERIGRVRGVAPAILPNGVDLQKIGFRAPSRRPGFEILFVGVLGHPPNAWAARFLAERVLPEVREREPRATLVLSGADPTREVLALASEHVTVTGRVPSVVPYLERAAVYANPLMEGAGTSLKVLEAFASGIPLVSTAHGVRGFDVEHRAHYLRAESPDEFATRILDCLRDREACNRTADRARAFAETHQFSEIAGRFATMVEAVAHAPRAAERSWLNG